MGAFSYHRFVFLLACIDCWNAYNRLVFACTVKTAIKVNGYVFQLATTFPKSLQLAKNGTLFGLFVSHCVFCLRAPQLIGSI